MKKTRFTKAGATLGVAAVMAVALAPASSAIDVGSTILGDGLSWSPNAGVASNASVVPLMVANATADDQTMSITINSNLTYQVQVYAPGQEITYGCNTGVGDNGTWINDSNANPYGSSGFSSDFVVPAGTTQQFILCVGGQGDMTRAPFNGAFSIGGVGNGASNAQWYDFQTNFNLDAVLTSLQPYYSGTGGVDQATNLQNGFNIMQCSPDTTLSTTEPTTVSVTSTVTSPYSASTYYPQNYGWGAPVCMAWLPEGNMQPTSNVTIDNTGNGPVASTLALQTTQNNSYVSVVFGTTAQVTEVSYAGVPVSNSPSSNGWWTQEADGNLVIESVPALPGTTAFVIESATGESIAYTGNYVPPVLPENTNVAQQTITVTATPSNPAWAPLFASTTTAIVNPDGNVVFQWPLTFNYNQFNAAWVAGGEPAGPDDAAAAIDEDGPGMYAGNVSEFEAWSTYTDGSGSVQYATPEFSPIGDGNITVMLPSSALTGPGFEVQWTFAGPDGNETVTVPVTFHFSY